MLPLPKLDDTLASTPGTSHPVETLVETEVTSETLSDRCSSAVRQPPTLKQEIEIFVSTFFTILLAELGDKTQVTTLLMSAQSQSPWLVFVGAGAALVATSLLGVLLGRWLADRVCPKVLETCTGTLLLLISLLLLWDVMHL
jgi:putative Ca2+/H+ antiporter (TMEM165/GDT1 family)